jgi:hypothetical protein
MPRPRPWWPEPLKEWARETRADRTLSKPGSLPKYMRNHPDEIKAFMRGLIRSDAPRARPRAELCRPPPPEPLSEEEGRKRAIVDDLPVEKRRMICAAGRLLWVGFTLHRIRRTLGVAAMPGAMMPGRVMPNAPPLAVDAKAHATSVAEGIIREMRDLFGSPRLKSARALTLMFTGVLPRDLSMRAMRGLAADLPPVPERTP